MESGPPDPGAGRNRRPRAHPLHHLASPRHVRRPGRGARQHRQADAVLASAGAVGRGCGAPGHEPAPHRRRLSADRRAPARGAPGPRAVVRFHRRLPRRDRAGFRGDARAGRTRSASLRRSRSSTARGRAPRRPACASRSPTRSRANVWHGCRRCSPSRRARSTTARSAGCCRSCSSARGDIPANRSAARLICRRFTSKAPARLWATIVDVRITESHAHSLAAVAVAPAAGRPDIHCRGMHPCA